MLLWHDVEVEVIHTRTVRVLANNEKEAMLEVAAWEARDTEFWPTDSTRLSVTEARVNDPGMTGQEG